MPALRRVPTWQAALVSACAFFVLAVLATWPVATDPAHLSLVRPTENDFRLNNYLIFWGAHALLDNPLGLHHTNMFHPERYTFAYADMLLSHSLLMLPAITAFYNPVLTFNLLLLTSLTVGGVGFFVLARRITGHDGAAFLAAALWVFNPVHFTRYQQIQLVGDHWLPWLLWALWAWLHPEPGAGSVRGWRWPVAAATFFCLNALSGSHIAVFGALLAGSLLLYAASHDERWRDRAFHHGVAVFAVVCLATLMPMFWPYLMIEQAMADKRAETLDLANASLRPLEALSARSRFYQWLDATAGWPSVLNRSGRELRAYGFPGIVTLVLAGVGVYAGRPRRDRRFWLLALAGFLFLALGSYGGYLLVGNLPLFRLIRVPTRFMMPAVFCLAVLAGYGAAHLAARWPGRRRQAAVLCLAGALFAGEAAFAPLRTWPYAQEPRPLNEFLAGQPGEFAIVELPIDPHGYAINMRQVHNSLFHWKRLLVGYSGFQTQANIDLLRRVRDRFPAEAVLDELGGLDVRFIVVLADRVESGVLDAIAAQPRLSLAWTHEDWQVYRLLPTDGSRR